jgi:hypothetical protein
MTTELKPEHWIALGVGIATLAVSCLTIWAILAGPKQALRVQRKLDEEREAKNRKLWVFKTLMTFRPTRLAPQFIQALNMIDIEFVEESERPVRDVWRELHDHYTDWGRKTDEQLRQEGNANVERSDDLIAELLVRMGNVLGYTFDKVYIKKAWYYPKGLGNVEEEQHALRRAVLNLLAGQNKLPIAVFEQTFQPITAEPLQEPEQPEPPEPPEPPRAATGSG